MIIFSASEIGARHSAAPQIAAAEPQRSGLPPNGLQCGPLTEARRIQIVPKRRQRLRLGQPIVLFQETFKIRNADLCVIRQADRDGGAMR